jgi:hypothetical protein
MSPLALHTGRGRVRRSLRTRRQRCEPRRPRPVHECVDYAARQAVAVAGAGPLCRRSDIPSAPHGSRERELVRRGSLDSQPEVLDLLAYQLGRVAARHPGSHHLDDVFIAEPHDELAVLDPLLAADPPGGLVEVLAGEGEGEQPGAPGVQVVGDLEDLVLAGLPAEVLDFRDDKVRLVVSSHELPEAAVNRIVGEDVVAPVYVPLVAALRDRRVQWGNEQEAQQVFAVLLVGRPASDAGLDVRQPRHQIVPGHDAGVVTGRDLWRNLDVELSCLGPEVGAVPYHQPVLRGHGHLRLREDSGAGQHQCGFKFIRVLSHVRLACGLQPAAKLRQAASGLGSGRLRLDQQGSATSQCHEVDPVISGLVGRPAQQRRGDQLDFPVAPQDLPDE